MSGLSFAICTRLSARNAWYAVCARFVCGHDATSGCVDDDAAPTTLDGGSAAGLYTNRRIRRPLWRLDELAAGPGDEGAAHPGFLTGAVAGAVGRAAAL